MAWFFAAWGATEWLAATSAAFSAGAVAAALPSEKVQIGQMTLSASGGPFHVGDEITLSLEFDVSFGDVFPTGGALEIKIFEEGKDEPFLVREKQPSTSAQQHVSMTVKARAKKDGRVTFVAEARAWGDDDIPFWPLDWATDRKNTSNSCVVTIAPPVTMEFTPDSQDVGHGASARMEVFAKNDSELPAVLDYEMNGEKAKKRLAGDSPRSAINRVDQAHTHRHPAHVNPIPYYFEDNWLRKATLSVPDTWGAKHPYAQQKQNFGSRTVKCTRSAAPPERQVGLRDQTTQPLPLRRIENNFVCIIVSQDSGSGITCGGSAQDLWSAPQQFRTDETGTAKLRLTTHGQTVRLVLTPDEDIYLPREVDLPVEELTGEVKLALPLAPGPLIRGRVIIGALGLSVPGASVALTDEAGTPWQEVRTDPEGVFAMRPAKLHVDQGLFLRAQLPYDLAFAWESDVLRAEVDVDARGDAVPVVFNAKLPPREETLTLSGVAVLRDGITGEHIPVAAVEIAALDPETGDVIARSTSDRAGAYTLDLPSGRWRFAFHTPEHHWVRPLPDLLADLRSSRSDTALRFVYPAPQITELRPEEGRLHGTTNLADSHAEILCMAKGDVVASAGVDPSGGFQLDTRELPAKVPLTLHTRIAGVASNPSAAFAL